MLARVRSALPVVMVAQCLQLNTVSLLQHHLLLKPKALVVIIHHGNYSLFSNNTYYAAITKIMLFTNVYYKVMFVFACGNDKKQKPSITASQLVRIVILLVFFVVTYQRKDPYVC